MNTNIVTYSRYLISKSEIYNTYYVIIYKPSRQGLAQHLPSFQLSFLKFYNLCHNVLYVYGSEMYFNNIYFWLLVQFSTYTQSRLTDNKIIAKAIKRDMILSEAMIIVYTIVYTTITSLMLLLDTLIHESKMFTSQARSIRCRGDGGYLEGYLIKIVRDI